MRACLQQAQALDAAPVGSCNPIQVGQPLPPTIVAGDLVQLCEQRRGGHADAVNCDRVTLQK